MNGWFLHHSAHHWPTVVQTSSSWSWLMLLDGLLGAAVGGAVTLIGLRWTFGREDDRRQRDPVDAAMARLRGCANTLMFRIHAPRADDPSGILTAIEELMVASTTVGGFRRVLGPAVSALLRDAAQEFADAVRVWGQVQSPTREQTELGLSEETFVLGTIGTLWLQDDLEGKTIDDLKARIGDPAFTIALWPRS